jgi:CRISPR-associated endonuclease/helicase Cas3
LQTNTSPMPLRALARPKQSLTAHLLGVGHHTQRLCSELSDWARLIGLLHDYGKYRPEWVWGINEIAQGRDPGRLPPHAIEGALYLMRLFSNQNYFKTKALALLIQAHHGGLPDMKPGIDYLLGKDLARPLPDMQDEQWGIEPTFEKKLKQAITATDYKDLDRWIIPGDYRTAQRLRCLFGALVSADRQDAAMSDGWMPKKHPSLASLAETLATWYTKTFNNPQGDLNFLRSDFYNECRKAANFAPGWLSVRGPCGISKTWSVMQMALDHAAQWNKQKVIYCVPWTAILEQSHEQYQDKLGPKNVLGHWSTLLDSESQSPQSPQQLRNSRQWWDTPIVATTMVQLFDVLLGNKARTAQRMPTLRNAVIVLDEVQGLPLELLTTCIAVLNQLVQDYDTTIILSTATMPDYSLLDINLTEALSEGKVHQYFSGTQRVHYDWRTDPLGWQTIADEIVQTPSPSTLIVVNTVAACNDVFQVMETLAGYEVYKYTANMPPAHRAVVLKKIKAALLSAKQGEIPIIICATSAIETGVDLDCTKGYREIAGLESIVQFAGRINRNMFNEPCPVVVFKTLQTYNQPPGNLQRIARTSQAMALGTDLQSPEVLTHYSRLLLQDAKDSQAKNNTFNYLKGLENLEWEKVSEKWQMIAPTTSVLIDPRLWNADPKIVEQYDKALVNANYRLLQRHCIGLYRGKFKKALKAGYITESPIEGLHHWIGNYEMGIQFED